MFKNKYEEQADFQNDDSLLQFEVVTLLDFDVCGIFGVNEKNLNNEKKMHGKIALVKDNAMPNEEPELIFIPCMYIDGNGSMESKIIRRKNEEIPTSMYTGIASAVDFFKLNKFFESGGERYKDEVLEAKSKILPGIAPILKNYKIKMGSILNHFTSYKFREILDSVLESYSQTIENKQDEMMGRPPRHKEEELTK